MTPVASWRFQTLKADSFTTRTDYLELIKNPELNTSATKSPDPTLSPQLKQRYQEAMFNAGNTRTEITTPVTYWSQVS